MFNSHHKFLRLDTITNLCFTESEGTGRLSNLCKDTQLLARLRKDFQKEKCLLEFPGGAVVKNPPCKAGDSGLIPAWGTRILHAVEQLSPCDTATEPAHSGARVPHPESVRHSERARWPQLTSTHQLHR